MNTPPSRAPHAPLITPPPPQNTIQNGSPNYLRNNSPLPPPLPNQHLRTPPRHLLPQRDFDQIQTRIDPRRDTPGRDHPRRPVTRQPPAVHKRHVGPKHLGRPRRRPALAAQLLQRPQRQVVRRRLPVAQTPRRREEEGPRAHREQGAVAPLAWSWCEVGEGFDEPELGRRGLGEREDVGARPAGDD